MSKNLENNTNNTNATIKQRLSNVPKKVSEKLSCILDPVKSRTLSKRNTGEALTKEEYNKVLEENLGFEGFCININSMEDDFEKSGNKSEKLLRNRDFSGAIFDLTEKEAVEYRFEKCSFKNAYFKNIDLYNISFVDCFLDDITIENISVKDSCTLSNCSVTYIHRPFDDSGINDFFSERSSIVVNNETAKSGSCSPSYKFELMDSIGPKANKIGIIVVYDKDKKEKKQLKVLFRKTRELLSVIFLENYQVGSKFLQQNMIYTFDNIRQKGKSNNDISKDSIREKNYLRYDLLSQLESPKNNHFPQDENGHLVIDATNGIYKSELVFKLVRPVFTESESFKENFEQELENLNYR
ncbi:hypothetical protein [Candidatus Absconditicoccus praedator]|uniref:hypothetical protein n=1 Tax=Candidatus Absconditicoccus praedator TaxID=2735562 RepID=UPI001E2BB8B0|nr:hypothetical protein [Candidatus Absconditicoccus praedator]UFX83439.1 hypothetical protein HLG78_04900 [Candidatus Absconditicoccus praedator]